MAKRPSWQELGWNKSRSNWKITRTSRITRKKKTFYFPSESGRPSRADHDRALRQWKETLRAVEAEEDDALSAAGRAADAAREEAFNEATRDAVAAHDREVFARMRDPQSILLDGFDEATLVGLGTIERGKAEVARAAVLAEGAMRVRDLVDRYVEEKRSKTSVKHYGSRRSQLLDFASWSWGARGPVGDLLVDELSSTTLMAWRAEAMQRIESGRWKPSTADQAVRVVVEMVRWGYATELVEKLPRSLATPKVLAIPVSPTAVEVASLEHLRWMFAESSASTRLYLCLGLNIGATQVDIAKLKRSEVDLEAGVVRRLRSKANSGRYGNAPKVQWPLWGVTRDLLAEQMESSGELALLNQSGRPLQAGEVRNDGGTRETDAIASAWGRVRRKLTTQVIAGGCEDPGLPSFSVARATSGNMIEQHEEFSSLSTLFLGHSPKSVKDRHYVLPPLERLAAAVSWLEGEFKLGE